MNIYGLKEKNRLYGYWDSDCVISVGTGMAPHPIYLRKKRGRRIRWVDVDIKKPKLNKPCLIRVFDGERNYVIEATYTNKTDLLNYSGTGLTAKLKPQKACRWMTQITPTKDTFVLYWTYYAR